MAQIGTIRLQTQNSGTVSVPVFDTADAGGDVYDMVRVQTASGVGFIPFVNPSNAAYPYLRIQTQNQGVLAAHNDAALTQIIDDFNDGDLSEYTTTNTASITTSPTYEGSHALQINNAAAQEDFAHSTSGLNAYPSAGDTFEFRFWMTDNTDDNVDFYWAASSTFADDGYKVRFRSYQNDLQLQRMDNGSSTLLSSQSSISWRQGEWHRVVIDWGSGGSITVTAYDAGGTQLGQVSATDGNYTSGGISWGVSTGSGNSSTMYYDYGIIL